MSNCLSLKVEVFGGSSIEHTAGEACVMANKLDCIVVFDFNGVHCMAIPGGSSDVLVENWRAALKHGGQHPIASTHRRADSAEGPRHE